MLISSCLQEKINCCLDENQLADEPGLLLQCGHQHRKTLDIRVHNCAVCGYIQDRDIAAAQVMLYWEKGILPESGTGFVVAQSPSSTTSTSKHQQAGAMRQLGAKKRQKSTESFAKNQLREVETHSSGEANCG
jgi:putative transposase